MNRKQRRQKDREIRKLTRKAVGRVRVEKRVEEPKGRMYVLPAGFWLPNQRR